MQSMEPSKILKRIFWESDVRAILVKRISSGFKKTERGEVVNIVVQYEAMIRGAWHEIVRYDCEHGYFHRDLIYPKGKKEKQPIAIENLNDALQYAEQDLKDRWAWYKDRYRRRLKG